MKPRPCATGWPSCTHGKILAEGAPDELVSRHAGAEVAQVRVAAGARQDVVDWIQSAGFDYREAGAVITVSSRNGDRPDLAGLPGVRITYRPANLGGRVPHYGRPQADGRRLMAAALSATVAGIRVRSIAGIWYRHALVLRRTLLPSLAWYFVEPFVILVAVGIGIWHAGGRHRRRLVRPVRDAGRHRGLGNVPRHLRVLVGGLQPHSEGRVRDHAHRAGQHARGRPGRHLLGHEPVHRHGRLHRHGSGPAGVDRFPRPPSACCCAPRWLAWQFGALGLIVAALAPNVHVLSLIFTAVATPLYFFSGAFFPIAAMPGWVQPFAWAAPLTPSVHLARGFVTGELGASHLLAGLYVLGMIAVLFPLAAALFHRRLVT